MVTLIVPILLREDENPEDILSSKSYGTLIQVLNGLRAHDERVEMLAMPQENQKHVVEPSSLIGEAPGDGEEEARLLIRCAAPRDPALVAKWISYQPTIADAEGDGVGLAWCTAGNAPWTAVLLPGVVVTLVSPAQATAPAIIPESIRASARCIAPPGAQRGSSERGT
ncbi:hypothetical protein [Streptomyces sp. NPDC001568]|uniref:hypothetical protein n=1 Tax=Streptomyces sp. NPDC001568 TaxID=3364588 RepID=UPI0036B523ED